MPQRPQVFDRNAFEQSLRQQGCPEGFVGPITSDFKLFVPIAFRHLGEDKLLEIMNKARLELGLGEQDDFWRMAAKYIVGWADEQIEEYKTRKGKQESAP